MKKLTHILLFLFLTMSCAGYGQVLTQQAYEAYQAKEFEKAKDLIDESIESEIGEKDPQTWLVRAFIYKALENYDNPDTTIRNEIITSHLKSIVLDEDKQFYDQNMNGIKSAILRYYNQAVLALKNGKPEKAEELYKTHKRRHLKYFEKDFSKTDVEFYKAQGSYYNDMAKKEMSNPSEIKGYRKKALDAFIKVINVDSTNYNANYNIGTIYYNQGVDLIMNMDSELSIEEIRQKQDKGVELFLKAKPFIELAHKMTPERIEPVEALWGIYYGLSDYEKSEHYKKLLEKLKGK